MQISTICFKVSVLSKCCFPIWVEKVFLKICQEAERKPINYLFVVQNGKFLLVCTSFVLSNLNSISFKNIYNSSVNLSLMGRIRWILI